MQLRYVMCYVILLFANTALAVTTKTESCISAASRTSACPHQLYRIMQLPDRTEPAVRCICITDFQALINAATTPEQQATQRRLAQQYSKELGYDVDILLQVLRRER